MENKINIAELLKDCPKGMELDCTVYDNVTFGCIMDGNCYPIQIQTPEGNMLLSEYGCMSLSTHSKCVIFPKGKTTWEGFVSPCKFSKIMTREEQIRQMAKSYTQVVYGSLNDFSDITDAFVDGAKWADETMIDCAVVDIEEFHKAMDE